MSEHSAEKDAGWLVPQTCVRCGEQTMHDNRVCGRCAEKDAARSHALCWTGTEYAHRCQRPSGRRCIDCGEPAGTLWGPIWCPDCDVIRLDGVSASMESLLAAPSVTSPEVRGAPTLLPRGCISDPSERANR